MIDDDLNMIYFSSTETDQQIVETPRVMLRLLKKNTK